MLTVVEKRNGDKAIYVPVAGFENVPVVTLQKDGEIRWASIGPMVWEDAFQFSNAVRLALHLRDSKEQVGCGLCWTVKTEA